MKEFDKPLVTITPEEYEQLQECKRVLTVLWRQFGPHSWPREFNLPSGKNFQNCSPEEFEFYTLRSKLDRLFDYDDSE